MNVFIDTSTINRSHSGTGTYSLGFLKTLLKSPEIDTIIAAGGTSDFFIGNENPKLNSIFYGETNWHKLINLELLGNLPLINADVAVFPNYFIPFLFPVPSIATIHDISFLTHPQFYSTGTKLFYQNRILHTLKNSRKILTVSDHSKFEIIRNYSVPENQIVVIPPGTVFSNLFSSGSDSPGKKYFLYLGNIEPKKNILKMVDGFCRSGLKDHELLLVGKQHSDKRYFREVMSEISNLENIRYLGYSNETDVHRLLKNSAGLVNLSHVEGFGIPVLEAIHMDKPVLISKAPALCELLAAGKGISVDDESTAEISEGFRQLAKLKSADKNQQLIDLKYSWNSFNVKLMEVFEEVVSSAIPKVSIPRLRSDEISDGIFTTGIYSAIFNCPISKEDLFRSLYKAECTPDTFETALNLLLDEFSDLIREENGLLFFYPATQTFSGRQKQIEDNKNYIGQSAKTIKLISAIPFVKYLYFSGGTAHANHADEKDVDLFIVTGKNRVWISYSIFRVLAKINRNFHPMCFNYVVDEMAAAIGYQHDFYTAHQLIYLQPVNEKSSRFNVLGLNSWIFDFFPNMKLYVAENKPTGNSNEIGFLGYLNLVLLFLWTWNLRRKNILNGNGGVLIDSHRIKLHTNDHRPKIYERFSKTLHDVQKKMKQMKAVSA